MLVLNKNHGEQAGAFIGRPSPWGNPFSLDEYSREEAIKRFRAYAIERIQRDPDWLEPLRKATALVCFCSPLPCHGSVLIELLEATSE